MGPVTRSRVLVLLLLTLFAGVGFPGAASAHSELISSTPADGSRLDAAPAQVVLTFSEDIRPEGALVQVTDGEGLAMTDGKLTLDGPKVTQPLSAQLHPGNYTITYKVVSADGHPISDAIAFTLSDAAGTASSSTSTSSTNTSSSTTSAASATPTSSTSSASTSSSASTPAAASPNTDAATKDSGPNLGWILGGLALAGLAAAGIFVALRMSRNSDTLRGRHAR